MGDERVAAVEADKEERKEMAGQSTMRGKLTMQPVAGKGGKPGVACTSSQRMSRMTKISAVKERSGMDFYKLNSQSIRGRQLSPCHHHRCSRQIAMRGVIERYQSAETSSPIEEENQKSTVKEFSFVIANAKFLLDEEEHLAEVLRERRRFFNESGREMDFWVVPEPIFLEQMPEITKKLARPAAAVVSTDHTWITYDLLSYLLR